ncbi:MAG: sulfur carrier protein ThiS [Verrucomicrobiales bacterium]
MTIILNSQEHPLAQALTITELLAELGLAGKPVVAELNQEALSPGEHESRQLRDGDRLELITIAAGG